MGTWGPGPFSNDDALDLLDTLVTQPASQRREALDRTFDRVRDRPDLAAFDRSDKQTPPRTSMSVPRGRPACHPAN
jgi:hypothetical protein